jgi:hypothetical protein
MLPRLSISRQGVTMLSILTIAVQTSNPQRPAPPTPGGHSAGPSDFDHISRLPNVSDPKGRASDIAWRIGEPNVKQPVTEYPMVHFQAGDTIILHAGGCVQTGGAGKTWKSYVHPQGDDAERLYSGTVYIPGVVPEGATQYQRIGGFLDRPLPVPANIFQNPKIKPTNLYLRLGYEDDGYSDNGYYSHDDGNNNQCKGVGNAWVEVKIYHNPNLTPSGSLPTNSPSFPSPTAPRNIPGSSKPFDVVWDSNNEDANALPFNPYWAGQTTVGSPNPGQFPGPNFRASCGSAFHKR